ncbi:MAG: hypothetical protein JEZ09_04570 [Salinivirgaceae bacterium]|nr:hypothetical protein [Salinivirgaceae bacterium]
MLLNFKYLKYIVLLVCVFCQSLNAKASINTTEDIVNIVFFNENEINYVAFQIEVFVKKGSSYEQGNLRTEGYNENKLCVFNLNNGELLAEKIMGRQDSLNAIYLIGYSNGNLWIYSKKHKSGLQSLDPLTLDKKISLATIYKTIDNNVGLFIDPEWREISKFYSYNTINNTLILTSSDSISYEMDPNSFSISKTNYKINTKTAPKSKSETNNYLLQNISLLGYKYMKIKWGTTTFENPTFLYGNFINNIQKDKKYLYYKSLIDTLKDPDKTVLKNMKALEKGLNADETLLLHKNTFFVVGKSMEAGNAVLNISNLLINSNNTLQKNWDKSISGMFYNVSMARFSNEFKAYFGENVPPNCDAKFFLIDDQLIIIYLLRVCYINANTGEIIWQIKL